MTLLDLRMLFRKVRLRASYYHCPPNRLSLKQVSLKQLSVGPVDLVVPRNEDVGRLIYYLRTYESECTDYLMRGLRPDDVCFDVGANLGYYTVLMAKAVPQGRVYAFEPDPLSNALLQLNVQINRLENVVVNCLALGESPGASSFFQCTDSAFNSFRDTGRKGVFRVIQVPVTTLDEFVVANDVPRVDFMKVDVEGAEGLVLAGAKNLLQNSAQRPRMLLVELADVNHKTFGDSAAEIVERLKRTHYEPFVLSGNSPTQYISEKFVNVFFAPEPDRANVMECQLIGGAQ
jgi:FkbM family methyltransferase